MSQQPRITVVCGHYGCGKTNLTLNLALEAAAAGERVTVADLDIVNPYFRSSEYGGLLEEQGVRLIAPVFAGTTLDTPTLPPELYSIFEPQAGRVFIDAGGDDAGVTALGGLHSQLEETGYQMLYVINRYRVLSQTPEEAAALLQEIEAASRLKATALVNNSHLGWKPAWIRCWAAWTSPGRRPSSPACPCCTPPPRTSPCETGKRCRRALSASSAM